MLFAVSRDAVLAGLFGARNTEYACVRLVCVHSTSYYTSGSTKFTRFDAVTSL